MFKDIEPKLKTIIDYLQLKQTDYFIVPEYQRAYSWEISPQCEKLWQDIEEFELKDDQYFFGTIIVDCSQSNQLSLIDGQQRTITFFLLLKALLLRLNEIIPKISDSDESGKLKAGLEDRRKDIMEILYKAEAEDVHDMLKDPQKIQGILILESQSINELYPKEFKKIIEAKDFETAEQSVYKIPYKRKDGKYTNYFRNFKFFYNELGEKKESELNEFAKKFLKFCQVIEIRSWQTEQAIMMFNSLNSTGMPLSDADIISAQLYSNADEKDKTTFKELWTRMNELAEILSMRKIINIDSILQQFMYINRAIEQEYVKKENDTISSIDVTMPGLRRYYTEIKKDLLKEPIVLCNNLNKIADIWDIIKDFPTVKLLLKFNENVKLFWASYLYRYKPEDINENIVVGISELLLRLFTLLELDDSGFSSTKFKTFLFGENIKFVDKNIPIDIIKKDFDEHIKKNWGKESIVEAISEYDGNILVFLNEYLYARSKGIKFDFRESVNIEHIMPASGSNIKIIQQDAEITDDEDFNSLVNKLGNKILLEDHINKTISNGWFKTKKQTSIKNKSGYKDSEYAIALSLTEYPKETWTKDDINKATAKIAERIKNFIFNK